MANKKPPILVLETDALSRAGVGRTGERREMA